MKKRQAKKNFRKLVLAAPHACRFWTHAARSFQLTRKLGLLKANAYRRKLFGQAERVMPF